MTAEELARKATDIAKNYKTSYIWGGLGKPITEPNLQQAVKQYSKNTNYAAQARRYLNQSKAFFFDCVGLIKSILWGWCGDASKTRGGAVYGSNGVPDISADQMITKCSDVSTAFTDVQIGEALWCAGHIGIYIGNGLAVECTPSWKNGVQITAVGNMGSVAGYPTRRWTKHGKLPYVRYGTGEDDMTKEDVIKIIQEYEAAKAKNPVSDYAKSAWTKAKGKGIMDGTAPNKPATREQLAAVLDRLGLL